MTSTTRQSSWLPQTAQIKLIEVLIMTGLPCSGRRCAQTKIGRAPVRRAAEILALAGAARAAPLRNPVMSASRVFAAAARSDDLRIPALSVFAIEEPENHLSPYYLARIVRQVRSIVGGDTAQALLTSHAPAVLSRVEPPEVRYCRCYDSTRETHVTAIELPKDDEEAGKFVRGAMLAFPELYFARFVILVEGDSERVVLPRLAQAEGLLVDPSFVAIVPLGGRHVQYFWTLLEDLSIPYATLLDLDVGRKGGG
ncbi:ATP-dependent nuclease [Bradyrhizobium sp. USDA 4529]